MKLGAELLLKKYGTALKVAEALLKGEVSSHDEEFVDDLITPMIMEAAKFRMGMKIKFTKRADDIHACIVGNPGYWGCGKNQYEAVGQLFMSRPELFGVKREDIDTKEIEAQPE